VLKLALGMAVAVMLNMLIGFKRLLRASMLLPWIIPTVLSTLAWKWMFDPTFSIVNWMLFRLGFINVRVDWLGGPVAAMWSVILSTLAGCSLYHAAGRTPDHKPHIHEAAAIDGALAALLEGHVALLPVTMVVMPSP
jgi:multiple sugar transport system permease protein